MSFVVVVHSSALPKCRKDTGVIIKKMEEAFASSVYLNDIPNWNEAQRRSFFRMMVMEAAKDHLKDGAAYYLSGEF
jgi:hypothetical protein